MTQLSQQSHIGKFFLQVMSATEEQMKVSAEPSAPTKEELLTSSSTTTTTTLSTSCSSSPHQHLHLLAHWKLLLSLHLVAATPAGRQSECNTAKYSLVTDVLGYWNMLKLSTSQAQPYPVGSWG
jgi:hypothetical protein